MSFAPWRARSDRSIACWRRRAQARGHGRVVDGDHAALAGGDHLARVQREAGQRAQRADRPALVRARRWRRRRPRRARARSASASAMKRVHVGRQPDLVHGHDRLRALGDRALGRRGVEVVGQRVDVGEDRRRAALPDRVGGGDERQRRDDDLVAGADAGHVRARGAAPSCSWSSATASGAPTRSAKAASNAATRGPWETQPEATASATAAPSASVSDGRANGTSIRRPSPAAESASSRSARHQSTRRVQALVAARPRPRSPGARARRSCRPAGG